MNVIVIVSTFCFMEFTAWFLHKYIMHGFLWNLHLDHHQPTHHVLQKNDFFFLLFAVPSAVLIILGSFQANQICISIGTGITLYGFAYFLVHEVYIHRRLNWFKNTKFFFFKAVRAAHQSHHAVNKKGGARNFGMLIVPLKYYKEALKG